MHYYQHNIGDYRKDTGHLSLLEHGIYRQLLDTYYLDEKPIETQPVIRRLRISTQEEIHALESVLADFFEASECGNFFHHKRCEGEIVKYQARAENAKANGIKGGRPPKPKKTQSVNSGLAKITNSKANHKPITNNQEPLTNKNTVRFLAPTPEEIETYFLEKGSTKDQAERFYNFYESKGWLVGKAKMKKWKAAATNWINRNDRPDQPKPKKLTPTQQLRQQIMAESPELIAGGTYEAR